MKCRIFFENRAFKDVRNFWKNSKLCIKKNWRIHLIRKTDKSSVYLIGNFQNIIMLQIVLNILNRLTFSNFYPIENYSKFSRNLIFGWEYTCDTFSRRIKFREPTRTMSRQFFFAWRHIYRVDTTRYNNKCSNKWYVALTFFLVPNEVLGP